MNCVIIYMRYEMASRASVRTVSRLISKKKDAKVSILAGRKGIKDA